MPLKKRPRPPQPLRPGDQMLYDPERQTISFVRGAENILRRRGQDNQYPVDEVSLKTLFAFAQICGNTSGLDVRHLSPSHPYQIRFEFVVPE